MVNLVSTISLHPHHKGRQLTWKGVELDHRGILQRLTFDSDEQRDVNGQDETVNGVELSVDEFRHPLAEYIAQLAAVLDALAEEGIGDFQVAFLQLPTRRTRYSLLFHHRSRVVGGLECWEKC